MPIPPLTDAERFALAARTAAAFGVALSDLGIHVPLPIRQYPNGGIYTVLEFPDRSLAQQTADGTWMMLPHGVLL